MKVSNTSKLRSILDHGTRNVQLETRSLQLEPKTCNLEPETCNLGPKTRNLGPARRKVQLSIVHQVFDLKVELRTTESKCGHLQEGNRQLQADLHKVPVLSGT